jgi:putative nucleotidyltransferase with HDIG domain
MTDKQKADGQPQLGERSATPSPSTPRSSLGALRRALPFRRHPVSPIAGETEQYKGTEQLVILSGVLLTLVLTVIMTVSVLPGQVQIEAGMPATQDIFSPTYVRYESKLLTDKARDDATRDPANEVWVQDSNVVQQQRSMLLKNLSIFDDLRNRETTDKAYIQSRTAALEGVKLTQAQVDALLSLTDSDYNYWRNSAVLPAFDAAMRDRRLTGDADVQAARSSLPDQLVPALTPQQKELAIAFVSPMIVPNMHLDEDQTQQRRDAAAANVKPVVVTVQKGEAIIRVGQLATPEDIEKMQQAGLLSPGVSAQSVVGTIALVGLLMLLLHVYIYRYAPLVWRRQKQLMLVGLLIVVTISFARIFLPGHALLPYLLPVAAVSMLIAVLLNPNLAVMVTFVLSVLLGLVVSNSLSMDLPIYYFIGGLTGIFTLTKIEKVTTFARSGFYVAVVSFIVALALRIFTGNLVDASALELLALAAIFNGGMSASIAYATFSLLGTIFGITTPLQLMELAHPDQPLLKRLIHEAPGTYHHSLLVSNLAERAAEMIGADALLTRVSAYYHDIGKVERPYYFIDNQAGQKNVHDELSPKVSAAIIAGHVRDGVRLGQKYKLPRRVLDAIPQHHGTMLIRYFYHKALEEDPNTNPDDFRYPGPKPQTKENAILMLADGVEAAVRAMAQSGGLDKQASSSSSDATETPTLYDDTASLPDDVVANVVHKIISERIEDGQLDECDLTVRDIARIQEAFVSMLKGIYHPRVSYPEAPKAVVPEPEGDGAREPIAADGRNGQSAVPIPASEMGSEYGRKSATPGV